MLGKRFREDIDADANSAHIDRVEAVLGLSLPPAVRAFFQFTTKMKFTWGGFRVEQPGTDDENWREVEGGTLDIDIDYLIEPMHRPMAMDALEGLRFEAHGVAGAAEEVLLPFDFHSYDPGMTVDFAAFLLPSFDVIVTNDNAAALRDSCLLTFEEYMDLMFRTFCSVRTREALVDHRLNSEMRAREAFPALFERQFSRERESVLAVDEGELRDVFRGR